MFWGIRSYVVSSTAGAVPEALVEASIQVRTLGFQQVLVLSNCRKLVLLFNEFAKPDCRERKIMADLSHMKQTGLVFKLIFVLKVVLDNVWNLAKLATDVPTHFCWPNMVHFFWPNMVHFCWPNM